MQETGKGKKSGQKHTYPTYYQQLLDRARCCDPVVEPEALVWFDIKHYEYLHNLSLRQIMTELVVRGTLCTAPDIVAWDGAVLGPSEIFNACYPKIIAGEPAIHQLFISHEKIPELNYVLSPEDTSPALTLPVRELSIGDIDACYHALSAAETGNEFFTLEETQHPCYLGRFSKSDFEPEALLTTLQTQAFCSDIKQIYLAIDPSFSKSQLLDAFREVLTSLDDQYGIFMPPVEHNTRIRKKLLYDIKAYHIIPLIDLLLWQVRNRKTVPLRNIYNLLKNNSFNASSADTGYSETNFRTSSLRTFDLVMNQGNPGEVLSKLLEKTDDYDAPYKDVSRS